MQKMFQWEPDQVREGRWRAAPQVQVLWVRVHGGEAFYKKPPEMKRMAIDLYLEGLGFRAIGRVLKISHGTVYQWVRKMSESASLAKAEKPVAVVELDEMHSYVGRKNTAGYVSRLTGTGSGSWILYSEDATRWLSGRCGIGGAKWRWGAAATAGEVTPRRSRGGSTAPQKKHVHGRGLQRQN